MQARHKPTFVGFSLKKILHDFSHFTPYLTRYNVIK